MSEKWLHAICRSSFLIGIFIIKKCAVFSLTSSGALKYDCVVKTFNKEFSYYRS